jgi:hypothetical protein
MYPRLQSETYACIARVLPHEAHDDDDQRGEVGAQHVGRAEAHTTYRIWWMIKNALGQVEHREMYEDDETDGGRRPEAAE